MKQKRINFEESPQQTVANNNCPSCQEHGIYIVDVKELEPPSGVITISTKCTKCHETHHTSFAKTFMSKDHPQLEQRLLAFFRVFEEEDEAKNPVI